MKLIEEARWVWQRAWSVRLLIIAALLTGLETSIQIAIQLGYHPPVEAGIFGILAGLVSFAALIARFVAQVRD